MPDSKGHVLVSGASRGIGRQCAVTLAQAGFQVLAGVRTPAAANEINALGEPFLRPVLLDVTEEESIAALAEELEGAPLQGLVNNAGTAVLGPLEFIPLDEIRGQFEVNLFGHIAVTQAFLPKLREARGRIVNISSISGFIGFPFYTAYCASKFAIEGLSDSLRRELRDVGISVSIVQPGNIATDIWETSFTKGKNLEERFPAEASQIYGTRFAGTEPRRYGPARTSSPDIVADAVLRALTDPKPKARYLAGSDARRLHRLRRLLPDFLLDRFV